MKAKISPRINLADRTKLEDVIPLQSPITIFIDPSSACNFKCRFCPNGYPDIIKKTNRHQGQMNFVLYKKIIDSLNDFDKPINIVRLYKDGEPLLNKNFVNMVRYAKENGNVNLVDTTTNGFLLNPKLSKDILDAGLDKINISIVGMNNKQYLDFADVKIDFDNYVKNIKYLYDNKKDCEIVIKIAGDILTNEEKTKFYDTFGDYCDRINIENISPCWPNFDVESRLKSIDKDFKISQNIGIYGQYIDGTTDIMTCPYLFYSMTVNSDGSVSACFLDWERKLIIGDVKKQSLKEIWNGEKLYNYEIQNLEGKRKENYVCRNCGQLTHCMPDNIDPYTKDILLRMKK